MSINSIKQWLEYRFSGEVVRQRINTKRKWKAVDGDHTLRLQYPLTKDSVVVDVGGYRGQWASDIYAMYRCQVHVFEPIPSFAENIRQRFAKNDDIKTHPVALGARNEYLEFSESADDSGRFAVRTKGQKLIKVSVRKAAEYFQEHGISKIDLIKLNVEGDEYDLLDHLADAGMLAMIKHVQVQFHRHVPDANQRLKAAHALLMKTHKPSYQYDYVWESWERRI